MHKLLLPVLALLLSVCPVSGAEPIESAFGFQLGQKFEPTTPLIEREKDYNFHDVYPVTPPVPNAQFPTYYVRITPTTHLISAIIAVGRSVFGEAGVEAKQAIEAYLQARYGEGSRKFADEIRQDHRFILVGGAWNPARTITNVQYIDGELEAQGNREQTQLDAEHAAEHARQLLKTFDGAGM